MNIQDATREHEELFWELNQYEESLPINDIKEKRLIELRDFILDYAHNQITKESKNGCETLPV